MGGGGVVAPRDAKVKGFVILALDESPQATGDRELTSELGMVEQQGGELVHVSS